MAGQPQRGSRGRGRSTRRASSSAPRGAAFVAGSATAVATAPAPALPDRRAETDLLVTRTTYRLLLLRGLAPDEAANLTAFMCGIPIAEVHWSLRQVNQLLFLRQLARTGRFGARDGESPRPH
jgi:hypothetical protein